MSIGVPAERLGDYVGQPLGSSEWMRIDQERIDRFAEVTEDRQFIHVDPQRARRTPYGGTVAHGFLSLSLLTYLTADFSIVPEGASMGINYGFDKVRFPQPVRAGQKIRASATMLAAVEKHPGQFLITSAVTVEILGEKKPAVVAEWIAMVIVADAGEEE